MKLWEKKGTELSGQKVLSVKEVLDEVWTPTLDQWNDLCRKLESGNMMFSEFEHLFRKLLVYILEFVFFPQVKWFSQSC
jgi:hypothetical protein